MDQSLNDKDKNTSHRETSKGTKRNSDGPHQHEHEFGLSTAHTRIIKLSCLSDAQPSTSNDENFFDIDQITRALDHSARQIGLCGGSGLGMGSQWATSIGGDARTWWTP